MKNEPVTHACDPCDCLNPRRDFIRQVVVLAAGLVAGSRGIASALDLPVGFGEAAGRAGDEITYPLPAADGATIDRDNAVIVVRFKGKVMAFNLSCPHQTAAVRWRPVDLRFECSKHDSVYTPDGIYVGGRATRNMDRFTLKRSGNSIIVNVAQMLQSDEQKAAWETPAPTCGSRGTLIRNRCQLTTWKRHRRTGAHRSAPTLSILIGAEPRRRA
jgi:nitrite reductase/ring-hydroxylating ferredoxin subunit